MTSVSLQMICNTQWTQSIGPTTGNRFGLEVSRTKTEVQCIEREKQQMKTLLGGTEFTQCEEFVYLVVQMASVIWIDRRIGLAAGIVRNLHSILESKGYQQVNKSSVSVTGPVDCSI